MPEEMVITITRALWGAARQKEALTRVEALPIDPAERAVVRFATTLTLTPWEHTRDHVAALRDAGWSDRAIHDLTQVVACFNYMNRLADGLGVEMDASRTEWADRLLGDDARRAHQAWAAHE